LQTQRCCSKTPTINLNSTSGVSMKKKFLKLVTLLTLFASSQAYAQHNDEHEGWPENTLLALEGLDAITKEDCLLFVTEVGFTGPEQTPDQFYAVVETSYNHAGSHAAPMTVKSLASKPGTLSGVGANGQDQIVLFLNPQSLDLRTIKSFNIKWLHGNHFHTNRCVNMKVHAH
jgi:hypothetical protein